MHRSRMFIQTVGGMRAINLIVVHCSATREDRDFTEQDLDAAHRARGFQGAGYHFYIRKDGRSVVCGHRDLSPDLNGNGRIDPHERLKECPSYSIKEEGY